MNTKSLRIHRKPFDRLTDAEREAWCRLLAQSTTSRWAFFSPTYAEAVNATVGPVDVLLCRDTDGLAAIMPLQRAGGWVGRMGMRGPVGREMTDYFGLLARDGVRLEWNILLRSGRVPGIYFTHLDESQTSCGLTGTDPTIGLRTRISPEGPEAYWQWLRARDKKFTSDTERRERKLVAEHGPLTFGMNSATPEIDLALLVSLKNAQYRRSGRTQGALLNPANVQLLTRLLDSRDPDCMPRLSVLKCGEQLVAAHFGLQCGPSLHYWFPVYDPSFEHYAPGRLLYRNILFDCPRYGINCLDRGAGDSAAKRSVSNHEHNFFKGLVYAGPRGHLVGLAQRLLWHLQRV